MNDRASETFKVVLVGDSGVGKTSIISQLIKGEFEKNRLSTMGASFSTKVIKFEELKREIVFEIWDTAGQEKYRSLTQMFYQNSLAAIFVYDITREESFESLRDFWIDQLLKNAPTEIVLAIAANKSDMDEEAKVDDTKGLELANSINAIFKLTSAMQPDGIVDLFKDIGKEYLKRENNKRKTDEEMKNIALFEERNFIRKESKKKCCLS